MRRAGRGVTEDSAADVHCRLLDRRRPPGLVRVRAGSGMSVITATQPSGTVDIRVARGEPAQNVGDRETFSRTWIFVIIHDGGGGVRRNRRGSVVGSHDTVQRPVRVRCADCVRDVVLVRGRVLAGCRRRAQASGRRRRLGRARYRAMSVGGRPASGPPVSGTDPRWVGCRAQVDVPPAQLCTREARIRAGSVGPRVWVGAACASWTTPAADQDPPGSRGEPRISIT